MDIAEFYQRLPDNSKCRLADNPETLGRFLNGNGRAWPYLMLSRDTDDDSYTLHLLCGDYEIPEWIQLGGKAAIDIRISTKRKRRLVGVELVSRDGLQHQFLDIV